MIASKPRVLKAQSLPTPVIAIRWGTSTTAHLAEDSFPLPVVMDDGASSGLTISNASRLAGRWPYLVCDRPLTGGAQLSTYALLTQLLATTIFSDPFACDATTNLCSLKAKYLILTPIMLKFPVRHTWTFFIFFQISHVWYGFFDQLLIF